MQQPDRQTWRRATGADLWGWSRQGHGLFRRRSAGAPRVRIVDDLGRTIADGIVVAYDMAEQQIALLGAVHRPGTGLWRVTATAEQIWIESSD